MNCLHLSDSVTFYLYRYIPKEVSNNKTGRASQTRSISNYPWSAARFFFFQKNLEKSSCIL